METAHENLNDRDKNSAQGRIRESQIAVLTRHFRNVMTQYNLETVAHRERCKRLISRELDLGTLNSTHYSSTVNFLV